MFATRFLANTFIGGSGGEYGNEEAGRHLVQNANDEQGSIGGMIRKGLVTAATGAVSSSLVGAALATNPCTAVTYFAYKLFVGNGFGDAK
jgi:hypothetical protein